MHHVTTMSVSGVAKPGPTRALARASAQLALASKLTKNHVINKILHLRIPASNLLTDSLTSPNRALLKHR